MLFGVGTNVQAGWLLVLAAMLVGTAAAGAIMPFRAIRGVVVERLVPDCAWAGDAVPVAIRVRNDTRSARGLILLRDEFLGEGTAVVTHLSPGETRDYAGIRHGARRGVHCVGRCELTTGAPFGVVLARRTIDIESSVVVYPRVFGVSAIETLAAGGGAQAQRRAPSGDTATVREYRPGDPLRHVHWRSTARTGRLVVREFEDAAASDVTVIADVPDDYEEADVVAAVACSIALAALDAGRGVRVVGPDDETDAVSRREILHWGARLASGPRPRPRVDAGVAILVTTDPDAVVPGASRILLDPRPGEETGACFARAQRN